MFKGLKKKIQEGVSQLPAKTLALGQEIVKVWHVYLGILINRPLRVLPHASYILPAVTVLLKTLTSNQVFPL